MTLFITLILIISLAEAFQSYNHQSIYSNTIANNIKINKLYSSTTKDTDEVLYDQKAWESGYTTCKQEICDVITTQLPQDVHGTYYRNGHAKFEAGNDIYLHPFDGDGMITAITIQNGSALFRNRFIRTNIYKKERKAKKILARGAFGTRKVGGFLGGY